MGYASSYRYGNETPEQTVQNLGAYIKYTHIKDSVMENGRVAYKMMGEGDLPVDASCGLCAPSITRAIFPWSG